MDNAQHCLDQAAECRRLMQFARSEADAYALNFSLAVGPDLLAKLTDTIPWCASSPPSPGKVLPKDSARADRPNGFYALDIGGLLPL
jgi:hypothetical protein